MPLPAAIPLILLCVLCAAASVYYGVVLARTLRAARTLPTPRDGLALPTPPGGWPRVCLVVPAHNEEQTIEPLARSLAAQDYPRLRIVFALDRCTDATEQVVRRVFAAPGQVADSGQGRLDTRVEIVTIASCPDDWSGKTHAAWRGVQDSSGARDAAYLLFADADTEFHPSLVRATVALAISRGIDLLSLLSLLSHEHWFERLVQPAAGFELVRQYPLDMVNRAERPRAFANGQFMLFRRGLYDDIGGHERVKSELLEDIAFARHLDRVKKSMPSRWAVFLSGGMLRCRMYRSWEAFQRGWKRIYSEASLRQPAQMREWAWRNRAVGSALPLTGPLALIAGAGTLAWGDTPLGTWLLALGAAACLACGVALARVYRDQGLPAWRALTYPVGAWMTSALLSQAAHDLESGRKTVWAGREYARGGVAPPPITPNVTPQSAGAAPAAPTPETRA